MVADDDGTVGTAGASHPQNRRRGNFPPDCDGFWCSQPQSHDDFTLQQQRAGATSALGALVTIDETAVEEITRTDDNQMETAVRMADFNIAQSGPPSQMEYRRCRDFAKQGSNVGHFRRFELKGSRLSLERQSPADGVASGSLVEGDPPSAGSSSDAWASSLSKMASHSRTFSGRSHRV